MKKQLLEKYWKGETSIAEEEWLRTNITEADEQLSKEERQYFGQLKAFVELQPSEQFDMSMFEEEQNEEARVVAIPFYRSFQKVAVVIALLLTVAFGAYHLNPIEDKPLAKATKVVESEDAAEAFEIAKASLLLISQKMNKGAAHIGALEKFEEAHDKINTQSN